MAVDTERLDEMFTDAREILDEWEGRWVDKTGPSTEANPALPSDVGRTTDMFEYFRLAQVEYFLPGRTGQPLIVLAKKVAELVEDYFFGQWRSDFARPEKLQSVWFDELRYGMLLSLVSKEAGVFEHLIKFPTPDLPHDDGAWNRSEADNAFYISLCTWLRSGNLPAAALKGKRPKLLQDVAQSILESEQAKFDKRFSAYINWYKRHEHEDRGNLLICLDGSILLGVAELRGLRVGELWARDENILLRAKE